MSHPFLADPERRKAFDLLTAVPTGSVRIWAEQLGWSKDRMQRFIDGLRRFRLGEVITCANRSTFIPADILTVADCRGLSRTVAPPLGSTGVKSTGPSARTRNSGANSVTEVPFSIYAVRMIPVMNEEFGRLIDGYQPVRADNRGSHRAGHELESANVDMDWCEQRLRELCRAFNPSKHGGGEPPRTLGYFTRGLIRDWQQYRLNLLTVERSEEKVAVPTTEARPSDVALEEGSPPTPPQPLSPDAMTAMRQAFENPGRRLEIA